MIYIVIPFLIMIICSFIIIVKIKFKSNQLASTNIANNQNNRTENVDDPLRSNNMRRRAKEVKYRLNL